MAFVRSNFKNKPAGFLVFRRLFAKNATVEAPRSGPIAMLKSIFLLCQKSYLGCLNPSCIPTPFSCRKHARNMRLVAVVYGRSFNCQVEKSVTDFRSLGDFGSL